MSGTRRILESGRSSRFSEESYITTGIRVEKSDGERDSSNLGNESSVSFLREVRVMIRRRVELVL